MWFLTTLFLTKPPIQSPYLPTPVHKCYGKLVHQAQDTYIAKQHIVMLSVPSTAHPLSLPVHRTTPPCTPLHHPGHGPSHVTATTTAISVATTAAAAFTSEAPCANAFSLWDSSNALLEVPKVQECTAGPCRMVWAASAITAWGGKDELTDLGSEGPLKFLFYFLSLFYPYSTSQYNYNDMFFVSSEGKAGRACSPSEAMSSVCEMMSSCCWSLPGSWECLRKSCSQA